MDQVRPHWVRYLDAARRAAEAGRVVPALDDLRWLIEEFRVSLFAQELGTIEPVSAKRLDRRWEGIA
jgi:ATP-dependent helicase HrpA